MKRLRDDVYVTPSFKWSFCSSQGELCDNRIDVAGAFSYLIEVMDTFPDKLEKYEMFLDVMKDFKAQRIDTVGVIAKVKELFKGHSSLIRGFNAFLPNGYANILNDDDKDPPEKTTYKEQALKSMEQLTDDVYDTPPFKRPFCSSHGKLYASRVDVVVALSYLREVRDMFSDQNEKCEKFLDVMKDFKARRIDTVGVIAKVKELFKGHPSLLLGFNAFVPNGYEIILNDEDKDPPKKSPSHEQALNLVNKIKEYLGNDHEFKSFLNILKECWMECKDIKEVYNEVSIILNDRPNLLDEFSRFLPDSFTVSPLSNLDDGKTLMK